VDIKGYIISASELELGGELYIPCRNRRHRKKALTKVLNTIDEYMAVVNMEVNLVAVADFKDGRYWIRITRLPLDRAYFTKQDGKLEKRIIDDPELRRMIKLMREDNLTQEEIEDNVRIYQETKAP